MSLADGNSSGAAPAKGPQALRGRLRCLIAGLVFGLVTVSAAAALSRWIPALVLLTPFAPQIAVLALLCAVLGATLRMRRWMIALTAMLALWQGLLVLPFLWPGPPVPIAGAPLRVLSINLWLANPVPEETIAYLLSSGADVIGTVETTHRWRERLRALDAVYPYHVDCTGLIRDCGVALFSRQPIRASFTGALEGGFPVVAWGQIDWEGKPLIVAELQVLNPMIGLGRGFQVQQGEAMASYFAGLGGDVVLMGDFNSVPWGNLQGAFRAGTAFDNRGRIAFTWPSWAPAIFRLPIDQIFVQGGIAVRDYRAGPGIGSDHLPVRADIYRRTP
jgi:endonuclease/exonuclease/phosphatase (EEP) superfamily protein YafD